MERLLCEKIIYSNRLRDDLNNLKFKPYLYKQVRNFIFITLILGGVFSWASASAPTADNPGSNIYVFINKFFPETPFGAVFFYAIYILSIIMILAFIPSLKAIYGKLSIWRFENEIYQKKLFIKFIYSRIPELESKENVSIEEVFKIYNSKEQDIEFNKNDLYDFCCEFFKKLKTKIPFRFIEDICNLIIINELIDGTLIQNENIILDSYVFIIEKNYELFLTPIKNI